MSKKREKIICHLSKLEGVTIPVDLQFTESEDKKVLILTMKYVGIIDNMQNYSASFEGWALLGKAKGYEKVLLDIEKTFSEQQIIKNKKEGHYNRFLYRIYCFKNIFDWFEISKDIEDLVNNFYNKYLNGQKLAHNVPNSEKKKKIDITVSEDYMENYFVNNPEISNEKLGLQASEYFAQLPVGLFLNKKPYGKHRIFTGGRSAIDFWTVTNETLNIIELKIGDNEKLGVLSELFFYTCFVRDVYINKIAEPFNQTSARGFNRIKNIKKIKSFILLEEQHPLLKLAYSELKKASKTDNKIEFAENIIKYNSRDYGLNETITYEQVEDRLNNKPIEEWSDQDVFDRYIAYGDDDELANPEIQKLIIQHGYIDELINLSNKVITNEEIIRKILNSDIIQNKKYYLRQGIIENVDFIKDEIIPDDFNWSIITLKEKNSCNTITLKDFCYIPNNDDYIYDLYIYKDNIIAITEIQDNNERVVCFLKGL